MTTIRVKLFGPAARAAAAGKVVVRVEHEAPSAERVLAGLAEQHASLRPALAGARLAVNHAFAAASDPVRPTDEVALIALVSGG